MEDNIDDLYLLFAEGDPSPVVTRDHSDPPVHSLHDQSSHIDMIMDPYIQQLQKASLSFEEIDGSLGQVLHPSLLDMHMFFSTVLEGATINIDTGTIEQVSETPFIFEILSTHRGSISPIPLPLFLPKGRNIIQQSWINFYIGAFLID